MTAVQHGVFVAPFNELSDPDALLEVATAAEAAGWDGLFLWDHVLRPPEESPLIADAWAMLAAIAGRTHRIRIGPMVTPVSRRRISTLVRQTVTIDHLSRGRLIMGLGLGVDGGGELSRFGEVTDGPERGRWLDEGAEVLAAAWMGEPVTHHGQHITVDDVTFLPRPVQRPRIPLWFAARDTVLRPVRRAARYDGLFAIDVDAPKLQRMLEEVVTTRGSLAGFDVAIRVSPIDDANQLEVPGVTWAMHSAPPELPAAEILALVTAGPAAG